MFFFPTIAVFYDDFKEIKSSLKSNYILHICIQGKDSLCIAELVHACQRIQASSQTSEGTIWKALYKIKMCKTARNRTFNMPEKQKLIHT